MKEVRDEPKGREARGHWPTSRVDGRLKTTGKATFAAEYNVDDVTHGALVFSRIARGKIKHIDTRAAANAPGVISVLTHENAR